MAETFALVIEGLKELRDLEDLDQRIITSARIAVNDAATRGRTAMAREVLAQINFPADYVAPRNGRLVVSEKATTSNLEATIRAQSRVTSLARFATSQPTRGQHHVDVQVKPGVTRTIGSSRNPSRGGSAFLIRLRSGSKADTRGNLGLAFRTPNGQPPNKAYAPKYIGRGVYLLYGPAVSQALVAASGGGIATELTPDILDMLQDEFDRQMDFR